MGLFDDATITLARGADEWIDVTVTQDGDVQPITGWDLVLTVKRRLTDPDAAAVLTKSTDAGTIVITAGSAGEAEIAFLTSDLLALPNARVELYAGLRGRDPSGNVHRLNQFRLVWDPTELEVMP